MQTLCHLNWKTFLVLCLGMPTPKGLPNFGAYTLGPSTMSPQTKGGTREYRRSPKYIHHTHLHSNFFSFIPRMKYNILRRRFSFSFPQRCYVETLEGEWSPRVKGILKIRGLAWWGNSWVEFGPAFGEYSSLMVGFTYHKAWGKIYHEPNLHRSRWGVWMIHGRVITPTPQ
jgi:hypothetical protein